MPFSLTTFFGLREAADTDNIEIDDLNYNWQRLDDLFNPTWVDMTYLTGSQAQANFPATAKVGPFIICRGQIGRTTGSYAPNDNIDVGHIGTSAHYPTKTKYFAGGGSGQLPAPGDRSVRVAVYRVGTTSPYSPGLIQIATSALSTEYFSMDGCFWLAAEI